MLWIMDLIVLPALIVFSAAIENHLKYEYELKCWAVFLILFIINNCAICLLLQSKVEYEQLTGKVQITINEKRIQINTLSIEEENDSGPLFLVYTTYSESIVGKEWAKLLVFNTLEETVDTRFEIYNSNH